MRDKGKEGGPRASPITGAMNHACMDELLEKLNLNWTRTRAVSFPPREGRVAEGPDREDG